ncbi:hypothetical protein KIH41_00300 [Litoribacter ruber]|uniref:Uncharacterized protein n=1 Tax=Litoribacter ruber TaxID=702568 RepID=A0AAP2CL94_9BACT|nr:MULTISPECIES: hypothetical protein [Litoribacter]MBS9525326.1 hypothetical protein [Litoribacter alkaliphilus]MBT0809714.1 hypothetical protein [Litoribacter ruber]
MFRLISGVLILQLLLSGCVSGPRLIESDVPFQEECLEILIDDNKTDYELNDKDAEMPDWAEGLDEGIFRMALVINGKEDLQTLLSFEGKEKDQEFDRTVQRLLNKVNVTSLEVSAIAGGLDCEEEKAEQLGQFLEKKERRRERNLTVASIITGASSSIIMGTILLASGSDTWLEVAGITGGLVEVYLGLKILSLEKRVKIEHPVNVLKMIEEEDNSQGVFPASVWHYFQTTPTQDGEAFRDKLLYRWQEYNDLPEDEFEVLFGLGGEYNAEMLQSRADLLDQLGAQITLMKQDLLKFNRFVLNR